MGILFTNIDCYVIDHRQYITNVYTNVSLCETETISYTILSNLFSILVDKSQSNRKRCQNATIYSEETMRVRNILESLVQGIPSMLKNNFLKYKLSDTSEVRDLAQKLFESTTFNFECLSGGNNSDVPLKCLIKENYFLIPPHSNFHCGNINEQCQKLKGKKFDILIADPPWWNKYIRRLKSANDKLSYSMMYNEDIAAIPVKQLLAENCFIAVWCTNAPSNIAAVKNIIFPQWGIEYVATWYWLKLTVDLQPVCPFGYGCKKQPYERVIIGKVGIIKSIPECKVIVSVPSALHSHKPPLLDILTSFVDTEKPRTLELFARYLLPNTTSVGYEPLKWQHISLFEEVL